MATKKNTEPENKVPNAAFPDTAEKVGNEATKKKAESVYTAEEFVKVAGTAFAEPYSPDIVRAALNYSGKATATKTEAENIVKEFANKEVSR